MAQGAEHKPGTIYNDPHDDSLPQAQPFTLTELMHGIPEHPIPLVREGSCFITGTRFIPSNTTEFERMLKKAAKNLSRREGYSSVSVGSIEKVMNWARTQPYLRQGTFFHAFRYVNTDGSSMADGMPYQGIVTNMVWLAILCFDTKDITILPFGNPKKSPHRNLFYDARGSKLASSRWLYDGSLGYALSEFHQRGFAFNLAKLPSTPEEVQALVQQNTNVPPQHSIRGIITDRNLPLNQVLQIISRGPKLA